MLGWFDAFTFKGLWQLAVGYGFGTSVFIGALAFAWFSPVFKKTALWVALGAGIVTTSYAIGVSNGSNRVQAKWDAANKAAAKKGATARDRAERDVERLGAERVPGDRYDRDNE